MIDNYLKILVINNKNNLGNKVLDYLKNESFNNIALIEKKVLGINDEIRVIDYITQFTPDIVILTIDNDILEESKYVKTAIDICDSKLFILENDNNLIDYINKEIINK